MVATSRPHPASHAAALLVVVLLTHLVGGVHEPYVTVLLTALVVATAASTLRLRRDDCAESRLALTLLAAMAGGGVALAQTAGLPGQVVRPWDAFAVSTLVLSAVLVVLMAVDRPWRGAERTSGSPYAL